MNIFVLLYLIILSCADPLPTGGANCTIDFDCGGIFAGMCINDICQCPDTLANPDCSYLRYSGQLAGGLNIGLVFVGIGGVGNFIIERTGHAIGQLLLMLSIYYICIPMCILACCFGLKKEKFMIAGSVISSIIVCLLIFGYLAGAIWSIIDGVNMLNGDLNDGNGYALYITHNS